MTSSPSKSQTVFDRSLHHLSRQPTSPSTPSKQPSSPPATQPCPQCGHPIGNVAGTQAAICPNCGFKDPCCE